jgi:hypothetical protein
MPPGRQAGCALKQPARSRFASKELHPAHRVRPTVDHLLTQELATGSAERYVLPDLHVFERLKEPEARGSCARLKSVTRSARSGDDRRRPANGLDRSMRGEHTVKFRRSLCNLLPADGCLAPGKDTSAWLVRLSRQPPQPIGLQRMARRQVCSEERLPDPLRNCR